MRGFRGSRSAQNKASALHSKVNHDGNQNKFDPHFNQNGGQFQGKKKELPDWLKTPETRAKEKAEAQPKAKKKPSRKAA